MFLPAFRSRQQQARPAWRWIVFMVASLLLHLAAVRSIDGSSPAWPHSVAEPAPQVSEVKLLSAAPGLQALPASTRPVAPRTPEQAPKSAPALSQTVSIAANTGHAQSGNVAGILSAATPAETDDVEAAESASKTEDTHEAVPAMPRYSTSPPPSAELNYDVQAMSKGQTVYGSGQLRWQAGEKDYRLDGEASVPLATVLNFNSSGMIDERGVAPVIYTQKRWRKSATNTHFHRERNLISFSASTLSYPRTGGEQDRASIIWQLAAIGRADPARFYPGAAFHFFVAGIRDAEQWEIQVKSRDRIETGAGSLDAWHLTRHPRHGSYDQKLDIWLAPELGWYPVRLRYTEANGDYLEMNLNNIVASSSH